MATRGLAIGPRISANAGPFSFSGTADPSLVRQSLLYWDILGYPILEGAFGSIGPSLLSQPEMERLAKDSILHLIPVTLNISNLNSLPDDHSGVRMLGIPGSYMPHIYTLAQIQVVNQRLQNGEVWAIAQGTNEVTLPPIPGTDTSLIEYELASCLPAPSEDAPIQTILDFRAKHSKDLLRFRSLIEEMRAKVASSQDPRRALVTACEEIALGTSDIKAHMDKAGLKNALGTLKAVLSVDQSALLTAALGGIGASTIGTPIAVGAIAGLAVNATITLLQKFVVGGTQIPGNLDGFAYVFHCEKKFGE